jgi:hypothetical protein
MTQNKKHSVNSTFRERVVEHVFVGEVMKYFWNREQMDVEVLRPEFDRGGYDLVVSKGSVSRFIQFKTVLKSAKTNRFNVGLNLKNKPNGCVVLISVDDNLDMVGFRWFGSAVGMPFPEIAEKQIAKHTKPSAGGSKAERADHRILKLNDFVVLESLEEVVVKLFS